MVSSVPVVGIVFGELCGTGWCSRKRRERCGIFVVGTLDSLSASFAFLAFVLAFAFPFMAFLELKSIAAARLGFGGHIAVLGEEVRYQGLK